MERIEVTWPISVTTIRRIGNGRFAGFPRRTAASLPRRARARERAKCPLVLSVFLGYLFAGLKRMNKALIVVPTYNERDNLPALAGRILGLPVAVDLLVVDDNSPDGTGKLADGLAARAASVHVLHRQEKNGLGRAYIAGFKWALERGYEFIFEMDGDFSHNPDDIPAMLEAAREADLVLGSRYINGIRIINWPLRRLMLSKAAANYVHIITGMPFTDPTGGYKCFRRHALQSIKLDEVESNGYSFQIEMTHRLWRQGMKIVEVPIIFTDRFQGHSKLSRGIVREALWMVWRLWFQNGMRRRPHPRVSGQDLPPPGERPPESKQQMSVPSRAL
jgi:dolichol-phosphate mannosyltransferase